MVTYTHIYCCLLVKSCNTTWHFLWFGGDPSLSIQPLATFPVVRCQDAKIGPHIFHINPSTRNLREKTHNLSFNLRGANIGCIHSIRTKITISYITRFKMIYIVYYVQINFKYEYVYYILKIIIIYKYFINFSMFSVSYKYLSLIITSKNIFPTSEPWQS